MRAPLELADWRRPAGLRVHLRWRRRPNWPDDYGHLTAGQAGRIAAEAGARLLVLTHFSQRYDADDGQRLAGEAASAFGGQVVLARDLEPAIPVPARSLPGAASWAGGFSWVPAELASHRGKELVAELPSPRDSNRWISAAVMRAAGTPSSIAAMTVQRPSPESET